MQLREAPLDMYMAGQQADGTWEPLPADDGGLVGSIGYSATEGGALCRGVAEFGAGPAAEGSFGVLAVCELLRSAWPTGVLPCCWIRRCRCRCRCHAKYFFGRQVSRFFEDIILRHRASRPPAAAYPVFPRPVVRFAIRQSTSKCCGLKQF